MKSGAVEGELLAAPQRGQNLGTKARISVCDGILLGKITCL